MPILYFGGKKRIITDLRYGTGQISVFPNTVLSENADVLRTDGQFAFSNNFTSIVSEDADVLRTEGAASLSSDYASILSELADVLKTDGFITLIQNSSFVSTA